MEQCFILFQRNFGDEILASVLSLEVGSAHYIKCEKQFKATHDSLNDELFVKLEGDYNLWQEVTFRVCCFIIPLFLSLPGVFSFYGKQILFSIIASEDFVFPTYSSCWSCFQI
jgi:hypothetical protein